MQTATFQGADANSSFIFDIGMDECQDTDFYLKKGFRVVAVDANPAVCAAAQKRYATEIATEQLTVVNKAISTTSDPLIFHVCETLSAWSTADRELRDKLVRRGQATFREVVVQGVTIGDLIGEYGLPYFAKVDIEGFDLICVRGFSEAEGRPSYISTEVNLNAAREQVTALQALGYTRFALVSQKRAPLQKPPRPALEGRDIDHTFAHHASGLFGRELPAEWTDAATVLQRCAAICRQSKLSGILYQIARITPLKPLTERLRIQFLTLACDWYDIHAS
jgi:FkbM family methyltransferase